MPIKIPEDKSLDEIWEFALLEMKRESDDPNLANEWVEFFVEKVRERCEKSKLKNHYKLKGVAINDKMLFYWEFYHLNCADTDFTLRQVVDIGGYNALYAEPNGYTINHSKSIIELTSRNIGPLTEIGKRLITRYGIDLPLTRLLCWIKVDDFAVYEVLEECGIYRPVHPELFETLLVDGTGKAFDINEYRKIYDEVNSTAIGYFWDWIDEYEEYKESKAIEEKLGFGRNWDDVVRYSAVLESYTTESFIDVNRTGMFRIKFCPIQETIPNLGVRLYSKTRITGCGLSDANCHLRKKEMHSWWSLLLNDDPVDIHSWALSIAKRYKSCTRVGLAYVNSKDIPWMLSVRKNMNKISNFARVMDYEYEIVRDNPIPMATHLISRVMDHLIAIQTELLSAFQLDLSMQEVICLICGMYFEMDWIQSSEEVEAFIKGAINFEFEDQSPLTSNQQINIMKSLLRLYYDSYVVKNNQYFIDVMMNFSKKNPFAERFLKQLSSSRPFVVSSFSPVIEHLEDTANSMYNHIRENANIIVEKSISLTGEKFSEFLDFIFTHSNLEILRVYRPEKYAEIKLEEQRRKREKAEAKARKLEVEKELQKEIHEKLQKAEEERKLKEKERRCKKPESSFTPIFSFPDIPVSDLSYRSAWASDIMESICEHYLDQGEDPTDAVMQFKQTISE